MIVKMSERRRWFSKSCDFENTKTEISWSNSDSDNSEDSRTFSAKKRKLSCSRKSKSWINTSISSLSRNLSPESNKENQENQSILNSPFLLHSIEIEEESPILTNKSPFKKSPVITRRRVLNKIRRIYQEERDKKLYENIDESSNSPELFIHSQLKCIEADSPERHCSVTQVQISPAKSENSHISNIESFPSQQVSQIISSYSNSSSSSSEVKLLYHEPPPRKKRFKKGGLGSQLQKAIDTQNTSLGIWQHELFLMKSKGEDVQTVLETSDNCLEFCVTQRWGEYGCIVIECKGADKTDFSKVLENFSSLEVTDFGLFLIVVSPNVVTNVNFTVNQHYQIFPPYIAKVVSHEQKKMLCLADTSRFVKI